MSRNRLPAAPAVVALGLLLGCGAPPTERPRWVVIGLDGAEWSVVRELWQEDRLPTLRRLAREGASATLHTDYTKSPIIWTTVATGAVPAVHGIRDFVASGPAGDVPVSSTLRRVPALWNMASASGRRVAVLGWWASWPAEAVDGVVVSDRALHDLEGRAHPPGLLGPPAEERRRLPGDVPFEIGEVRDPNDRLMTRLAVDLLPGDFDLVMVYLSVIDHVSHRYWRYFRPDDFPPVAPEVLAREAGHVPAAYEQIDRAIGRIVEAAGPDVNVLVLSDHGFRSADAESVKVWCDIDRVLERLGFLARDGDGVDLTRSRLYGYRSPLHQQDKLLRFARAGRDPGGRVESRQEAAIRAELEAALATVTYESGAPMFSLRDAGAHARRRGGDLVVAVRNERPTERLLVRGQPFDGAVRKIIRVSGAHGRRTHGLLIAAGPDVRPGAELDGIRIHDVAPTLLYGLRLPVGEDAAGRAWTELFTPAFRRANPLATIDTWGKPRDGAAVASAVDEELTDQLRALGYLD